MSIFINNKYTTWYYNIISNAKSQYRKKKQGIYYESHHIFPKCLGGSNKKENLVLLTAREHFICHWLLTKMFKNGSKKYFQMLKAVIQFKGKEERYYNSKAYEKVKQEYSLYQTGRKRPSSEIKKLKRYANSIEGKKRNSRAGKSAMKNRKQNDKFWTDDEIKKRVTTRKRKNTYSKTMKWCHTTEALVKRAKTRKINGIKYKQNTYRITKIDGTKIIITNLKLWCIENIKYNSSGICRLHRGKRNRYLDIIKVEKLH